MAPSNFSWFKIQHGMVFDPVFGVVSRKAGQALPTVMAVWMAVLDHASKAEKRGDVSGIDAESIDYAFGLEDGTTSGIIAAMTDKGLISEGCVVGWERLYGTPQGPMSGAERTRLCRMRKVEAMSEKENGGEEEATCNDDVTACNDVTHREEEKREEKKEPPIPPVGAELAISSTPDIRPQVELVPEVKGGKKGKAKGKGGSFDPDAFAQWWEAYPRKGGKKDALKAWRKLLEDGELPSLDVLVDAVRRQKTSRQWTDDGGKFIPLPATWLRGGRWEDRMSVVDTTATSEQSNEARTLGGTTNFRMPKPGMPGHINGIPLL